MFGDGGTHGKPVSSNHIPRFQPSRATTLTDDDGRSGTFSAHLLRIKGELFLDFFPEKPDLKENPFYQAHLLPVHTFAHVKQIEPTLQMSFPAPDWLKKLIERDPGAIQHEIIEGQIILSASTEELQTFWVTHLATEGAFSGASNMKRQEPATPSDQPSTQAS